MGARRYEISHCVFKQVRYNFEHGKKNFISTRSHVLFCSLFNIPGFMKTVSVICVNSLIFQLLFEPAPKPCKREKIGKGQQ